MIEWFGSICGRFGTSYVSFINKQIYRCSGCCNCVQYMVCAVKTEISCNFNWLYFMTVFFPLFESAFDEICNNFCLFHHVEIVCVLVVF